MANADPAIIQVAATIDDDHRLILNLPDDMPTGDVVIRLEILKMPTLDELLSMSVEERAPFLRAAAELVAEEYETNPDLMAAGDVLDFMDYNDEITDNHAG